jgi:hypothetical protein
MGGLQAPHTVRTPGNVAGPLFAAPRQAGRDVGRHGVPRWGARRGVGAGAAEETAPTALPSTGKAARPSMAASPGGDCELAVGSGKAALRTSFGVNDPGPVEGGGVVAEVESPSPGYCCELGLVPLHFRSQGDGRRRASLGRGRVIMLSPGQWAWRPASFGLRRSLRRPR